jgi:hypothetical protein
MNYTTAKVVLSCLFHYKTLLTSLHSTSLLTCQIVASRNFRPVRSIPYHYLIQTIIRLWYIITKNSTNTPPHHILLCFSSSLEVEVNLRPTVSRPVCLGVRHPSGTSDQFFFVLEIFLRQSRVCYFEAPSLTRGQVCNLLYNCFWALPEQSILDRSSAELTAIFYCLIWDSTNPYLYPPGSWSWS